MDEEEEDEDTDEFDECKEESLVSPSARQAVPAPQSQYAFVLPIDDKLA